MLMTDFDRKQTLSVSRPRAFFVGLVLASFIGLTSVQVFAQSNNDVVERLRQIDQVLNDLQRAVYKGEIPPPRPAQPVARQPVATSAGTGRFADIEIRLSGLEEQLRTMTGPIETAEHRVGVIGSRLDKLIEDIDFRLSAIERRLSETGTGAVSQGAVPQTGEVAGTTAAPGTENAVPGAQPATQRVVGQAAEGTRVLGSVPAGDLNNQANQTAALAPAAPEKPKGVLPDGTVRERYDFAYGLLRRLKMQEAEVALKEFLGAHEDDPLADNARYWLGESYFNRRDYTRAASTFFEAYSKSPKGQKARDNLFKLGKSLARMEQKDDACASFDELLEKFNAPADKRIRQRAMVDRTELGCQ